MSGMLPGVESLEQHRMLLESNPDAYTRRMQDFGFSIADNLKVFSQQCS
jgi:hypothetical protein